jgi:hypothetical protein
MTEGMNVLAPKGKTCPKELSLDIVGDTVPVRVPNNSYYRRRLAEGSLVRVTAPETQDKKSGGRK